MAKKDQTISHAWLAYCGNFCGDCLLFHGEVTDLARVLLRRLKQMEHDQSDHHSPQLPHNEIYQHYCHRLYEALYCIDLLRCAALCRDGGGSDTCKIRTCCTERNLEGCWDCDTLTHCPVLKGLDPVCFEAKMRTLLEIRENGAVAFLKDMGKRQKNALSHPRYSNHSCKSG